MLAQGTQQLLESTLGGGDSDDRFAQAGAQENGIHEVAGSIPASSTNSSNNLAKR